MAASERFALPLSREDRNSLHKRVHSADGRGSWANTPHDFRDFTKIYDPEAQAAMITSLPSTNNLPETKGVGVVVSR